MAGLVATMYWIDNAFQCIPVILYSNSALFGWTCSLLAGFIDRYLSHLLLTHSIIHFASWLLHICYSRKFRYWFSGKNPDAYESPAILCTDLRFAMLGGQFRGVWDHRSLILRKLSNKLRSFQLLLSDEFICKKLNRVSKHSKADKPSFGASVQWKSWTLYSGLSQWLWRNSLIWLSSSPRHLEQALETAQFVRDIEFSYVWWTTGLLSNPNE